MSDFANQSNALPPPFISSYSKYCGTYAACAVLGNLSGLASASHGTANQARYYPISLPFAYPVRRVWWGNGSIAGGTGQHCFAIYNKEGERLYTTGAQNSGTATAPQFVTPSVPFVLPAGDYYFGHNNDGTTNRILGTATPSAEALRFGGVQQQAVGAVALPDPWVPAAATVAGICYCGITWTDSGF